MIRSATSISPVPTRDVCVVIPALNEEKLIGRCIQSVLDAGLQPDQIRANAAAVLVCGAPQSEQGNWITAYRALEYFLSAWIYRPGQHALGVITRQAQHQLSEARGRLQPPSSPFAVHHSTTIQGAKR